MSLGKRIAEKRLESGLSQTELAEKIKTSPTMVSLYESDSRMPSYKKLASISHYLNTTVDYLMNGLLETGNDPVSKKIVLALRTLNTKQRIAVFRHICEITETGCYNLDIPVCNNAELCADAVIKKIGIQPPVDPYVVARELSVEIIEVKKHEEFEGLLIKSGTAPMILLDGSIDNQDRKRFTLAMLLGHLIMPWHLKSKFGRWRGEVSSDVTDPLGIEAREFAIALLVPKVYIDKDVKELPDKPSYKDFEELAYNRYHVSVTAIIKRYINLNENDSMIFLRCHQGKVMDVNEAGFPYEVVQEVHPETFAGNLMNKISEEKCTLEGYVSPDFWFSNATSDIKVFEESFIDPQYGWVMTILRIS